jgi:hypothetical protein
VFKYHDMKDLRRNGGRVPRILKLYTRWMWFFHRSLKIGDRARIIYSVNYAFRVPKPSLEAVDEIKASTPAENRTPILWSSSRSPVTFINFSLKFGFIS